MLPPEIAMPYQNQEGRGLRLKVERIHLRSGQNGFSMTNLKLMRQFYMLNAQRISQTASDLFPLNIIGQALSDQSTISGKTRCLLEMYVNYFDRHVRTEAENATIGIVLCNQQR